MTNQLKFIKKDNLNYFKQAKFTMVMDDLFDVYGLKPNEAHIYSKLLDRLSLSAKNLKDYSDNLGVFVKCDQTKLGASVNLSKGTVDTVMKKLRKLNLIWYYQEKKGLPNKIYFIPWEIHKTRSVQEDSVQEDLAQEEDNVNDTPENGTPSTGVNFELPSSTNSELLEGSSTNFDSAGSTNFVPEPDLSLKPDSRDIITKTLIEFSNNISQSINQLGFKVNTLELNQSQLLDAIKSQLLAELKAELKLHTLEESKPRGNDGVSEQSSNFETMLAIYSEQIQADALMQDVGLGSQGLVQDIVITMATMYDQVGGITVKGQHYAQSTVQSLLYRFDYYCAYDVIKNVKEYASNNHITDVLSFLKSTIINECLAHNFNAEKDFLQGRM